MARFFGCCRNSEPLRTHPIATHDGLTLEPLDMKTRPASRINGAIHKFDDDDAVDDYFASNVTGPPEGGPPRFVAIWTWGLSWVYVLLSFLIAVLSYQHVAPAGALGASAYKLLARLDNHDKFRGWATEEEEKAVHYLKSQISGLELEFPGRIETYDQQLPINRHNILGPFGAPECMNITKKDQKCVDQWGRRGYMGFDSMTCATECPYNRSEPQGPRCCGDSLQSPGGVPLPAFWSLVMGARAMSDLPKDVGEVLFSNIVFRVKGSGNDPGAEGESVLISAHYDSVDSSLFPFRKDQSHALPTDHGPGVGDDVAAVSVMVEVARTLAAADPLPRDVIFAFVNGEEVGCMGSTIFKQYHPWAKRPAVAINLEGKGKANSKEWLVRSNSGYATNAYAQFAPRPAGFSFGEWVFANFNIGYTDLSIYRRLGYHGMDLAFVHDSYVYHTPDDNMDTASPNGLQRLGDNLLGIVQGVAEDPSFPKPLTKESDPAVGLWNQEVDSDPPMQSGTVYVGMFDSWMWIMPEGLAKCLFGVVAVCSIPAVVGLLWFVWKRLPPSTSLADALSGGAADGIVCLVSVVLGVLLGQLVYVLVIAQRDLRTWFDWQNFRLVFVALTGAMPLICFELLRRGEKIPKIFRTGRQSTDHSAVLGTLAVQVLLLLVFAKYIPHIGWMVFWHVLLVPLGVAVEVAMAVLLFPIIQESASAREQEAMLMVESTMADRASIPLARKRGKQDLFQENLFDIMAISFREIIGVFAPLVLTMPQFYNLLVVFTYMVDTLVTPLGNLNGVLIGISGAMLALPFLPTSRRLDVTVLTGVVTVTCVCWVLLAVVCLFILPTDTQHYCYFGMEC